MDANRPGARYYGGRPHTGRSGSEHPGAPDRGDRETLDSRGRRVSAISDEVLAKTVHGAIRAFCRATGDDSIREWEEAEPWQRDDSLRVVRFHRENPDASPSAEHERWLAQKVA